MTNPTPSVATLFTAAMASSFAGLPANVGQGALGEWPPDGDHRCFITGLDIKPEKFKAKHKVELPGVSIQFRYLMHATLPDRREPLEFSGVPFILPSDSSQVVDEGNKTRIRIEMERLKGHLNTILGRDVTDMREGLEAAAALISASRVEAMVKCSTRKDNTSGTTKTYKTEYLTQNLSVA